MKRIIVRLAFALPLALVLVAMPSFDADHGAAYAQTRSLTEGPVVRRMLLFRSNKMEFAPSVGSSFGGLYQRDLHFGLSGRYHLTNSFSLGLDVNVAPVHMDTSVARNFADVDPDQAERVDYSSTTLLTSFNFSYIPLHGKMNVFGRTIWHYDVHLTIGVGGALVSSDSDDLSGFEFGPAVGIGGRIFFKDNIALNLRVTDYMYAGDEAQLEATEVSRDFSHHFVGMVGVSFFFPPEVRLSC